MSELPADWAATTLGEVADFVMGQAPPGAACNFDGVGTPFVKAGEFGAERPTIREWTTKPLKMAFSTDVLICVVGATCGKLNLGADCAIGRSVAAIRPNPGLEQHYLYALLKPLVLSLRHGATGSAQGVISKDRLAEIDVPLPPLAEQRRIVAKLDALTARTARARADLDRIPALAARYKQAVLAKAFSGELTAEYDPAEFSLATLSDVLQSTFYGPRFNKEAYCDAGVPTLRTTDFDDFGRVVPKCPPQVRVSAKDFEKWGLQDGDLLVTRTGSIGKCAVYETAMGPALPSAYLIRTRLDLSRIVPRFALLFLLSPSGQEQLGLGVTAVTQPNINAGVIERLRLPVPSLEAQTKVVARVDAMFTEIDRLVMDSTTARRLLDRLDQAILAKAFRGELVPQDPTDEPASVLLDRIRAERAATPKAKRGRKPALA